MALIKYIGRKATAVDNIAGSGVTWHGHGDVKFVTDRQARRLVAHADQWVLADESDSILLTKEPVTAFLNDNGERVEVAESALKKPLEHMDVDELRAYALEFYQKSFSPRMGRKRLIDEIEELQKGMDPFQQI